MSEPGPQESTFQRVIRERLEARAQELAKSKPVEHDPDLVPDVRDSANPEIDGILGNLSILDAYNQWCRKSQPSPGNRREGIKVSCPNPAHPDTHPSAWLNLDKNTWYCGGCAEGGDSYDIAAWKFGIPVPGYKTDGASFVKLRELMVRDMGYQVKKTPGGTVYLDQTRSVAPQEVASTQDASVGSMNQLEGASESGQDTVEHSEPVELSTEAEPTPQDAPSSLAPSSAPGLEEQTAKIISFPISMDLDDLVESEVEYPKIAWKDICPEDTFMWEWMQANSVDDTPEEYYFWLGMQALGFACGRSAVLKDNPEVRSNLYICLYGRPGIGKSKAVANLVRLVQTSMPYDYADPESKGTAVLATPGSAEALIDSFSRPVPDPSDPKKTAYYAGVKGLVRFDELAGLVGRSARVGSVLKPTLMEFYDGYNTVEIHSRGAGRTKAVDHFCQTITTTQPRAVRELVAQSDADSGFLSRWIFAAGHERPAISYGAASVDLTGPVDKIREVRAWAVMGRNLDLQGEPLKLWNKFFHTEIVPFKRREDETLLTRTDLTLKKCIILLTANSRLTEPTYEIVERACSLMEYLKRSYALLGNQVGLGKFEEIRQAVSDCILRYNRKNEGRGISLRELRNTLRRRNFQSDLLVKVLSAMNTLGDINEEITKGSRGPGTVRYTHCEAEAVK